METPGECARCGNVGCSYGCKAEQLVEEQAMNIGLRVLIEELHKRIAKGTGDFSLIAMADDITLAQAKALARKAMKTLEGR